MPAPFPAGRRAKSTCSTLPPSMGTATPTGRLRRRQYPWPVEAMLECGCVRRDNVRRFQPMRAVPGVDDGTDTDIDFDSLTPSEAEITRNAPPLISRPAFQRADGADLAFRVLLVGCRRRSHARRWTRPHERCGGFGAIVEATLPLLDVDSVLQGNRWIWGKIRNVEDSWPSSVNRFVECTCLPGDRSAFQWQQDAFGQVDSWLRDLGRGCHDRNSGCRDRYPGHANAPKPKHENYRPPGDACWTG